jgi:hypothetical protein
MRSTHNNRKILLLITLLLFLSFTCSPYMLNQPKLDWYLLFPEIHDLPNGWSRSRVWENCISAPLDSGCDNYQSKVAYYWSLDDYRFMIEIRFYIDESSAAADYPVFSTLYFADRPNITEFVKPSGIDIQNIDKYGCTHVTSENGYIRSNCCISAHYGRYLIGSSIWLNENPDYSILERIMVVLDERMQIYMNNPPILQEQNER